MSDVIVQFLENTTLLGGGEVTSADLKEALRFAPKLVAADGGARFAIDSGYLPDAVIGDFDSLDRSSRAAIPEDRLFHIPEQDSTDFDKCLRSISAPLLFGVGFGGGRLDHALAVLNGLVRHADKRCILLNPNDLCFHCPPNLEVSLPVGTRFSLFPMADVTGASSGLRWAIDGLLLSPSGQTSTSNEVSAEAVHIRVDGPGLLVFVPREHLGAVIPAVLKAEL